jgi:hypothetical protein
MILINPSMSLDTTLMGQLQTTGLSRYGIR